MSTVQITSRVAIVRRLLKAAFVVAALVCFSPTPVSACWSEYPDAEEAFRSGFEFFFEGDWERAIKSFKKAKEHRREANANCTVQISARNRDHKAYYLPRFYLGVASFRIHSEQGDEAAACDEAMMFFDDSLRKKPGETSTIYDRYRSRLRREWALLSEIKSTCETRSADSGDLPSAVQGGLE